VQITTAQEPAWLGWAASVLNVKFDAAQSSWITRLNDDGTPCAVVVYTRFSPHNCEMSIATDGGSRWASREFIGVCYRYPFKQLGLSRISIVIEEDNTRSLNLARKLGHVQEGILQQWFGTKNGVLMRMLANECRWV
jgi:RimJ/RimL family protein N-acetyltransferase